jgi:hypothetical protein
MLYLIIINIMKAILALSLVGYVTATPIPYLPTIDPSSFTEATFSNRQDHFDYINDLTYEQRYWNNAEHFDETDGPCVIYICGEYRCSVPETRMFPFMIGAHMNANMFVLEHRFYGESQVMPNWETHNLKLLSAEQALADLAYFI